MSIVFKCLLIMKSSNGYAQRESFSAVSSKTIGFWLFSPAQFDRQSFHFTVVAFHFYILIGGECSVPFTAL